MANEYLTAEEFKATAELTGLVFADGDIPNSLTAASRVVDKVCGRRFFTTTTDETRYYSISWNRLNSDRVKVDDLNTLTSLKTDPSHDGTFSDTWTLNTDFTYEPVNAALAGEPYKWIVRHPLGRYYFPVGYPRAIKIVGKFGFSEAPAEVKEATSLLASRLLKRKREAPFGIVTAGLIDGIAARISRTDPDVLLLLDAYMEPPFA